MKNLFAVICFLLGSNASFAQNDNYYATYSINVANSNTNVASKDNIPNMLSYEILKNLVYYSYSNENINYITTNIKDDKKRIKEKDDNISLDIKITKSNTEGIIDYKNNKYAVLNNGVFECYPHTNIEYHKTKNIKKINNWLCEEWIPNDKKYSRIHVWVCKDIPYHVNMGIFYRDFDGGVVRAVVENGIGLTLESFKKVGKRKVPKIDCSKSKKSNSFEEEILK